MFIDIHVHTIKRPGYPRLGDKMSYATPPQLSVLHRFSMVPRGGMRNIQTRSIDSAVA